VNQHDQCSAGGAAAGTPKLRDVLAALYDGTEGLVEFRAKNGSGPVPQRFLARDDTEALKRFLITYDAYDQLNLTNASDCGGLLAIGAGELERGTTTARRTRTPTHEKAPTHVAFFDTQSDTHTAGKLVTT